MRNKVQREIKHAKQHYLVNKIDDNKHDSKKLWQNLKELKSATTSLNRGD